MEWDSSTIVYIVAVVVYFLYSTFFRKKNPEQAETQERGKAERPDTPPKKNVSFDDLLKEIRREQGEREGDLEGYEPEEVEREKPRPAPEKNVYKDPEPYKEPQPSYYNEKRGIEKTYKTKPLVKLDDQVDLESTDKILGEVEDVAGEYVTSNKYGILLKNPETVREAIVVAEILNRKHFSPYK